MGDAIEKSIKIRYSQTGLNQMTREMQTYDRATHKLKTSHQKWDWGTKQWNTTAETMKNVNKQNTILGGSMNSLMLRFIGLNALVSMGMQGFQELQKWINESVQSFRSFEYAMAEVSSILDAQTRSTIPSLEQGIVRLSTTYGKSTEDLTRGMYEIISAAFDVKDAIGLLDVVTKASIAGLTSVEGAVRTFTGVLNAYGMSASHAQELSDKLFEAVVRGNFTFSQLESSLGYVVPIAAEAGVAFDEIAASMMSATRQGQHIDSVTRGLGLLIQNIINPTKEASEAARKYGIDMSATSLRIIGLSGFLKQLSNATNKYGNQILPELIGNMRSLRVAMALTSETGIQGFTEDMEELTDATGRTDDALAQIMNTQKKMADLVAQSLEAVNRSIGETWTNVDMWFKTTELWWKALISGQNPNAVVGTFEDTVEGFRRAYLNSIVQPVKDSTGKTIFDALYTDTDKLKGYLKISDNINDVNERITKMSAGKIAAQSLAHQLKSLNIFEKESGGLDTSKIWGALNKSDIKILADGVSAANREFVQTGKALWNLSDFAAGFDQEIANVNISLKTLEGEQSLLRPEIDGIKAAFEDANAAMKTYDENILTIKKDISDLNDELPELRQQLKIMVAEKPFEDFQHYSQLGLKYGEEYISEVGNVFDKYGNSLADAIRTIYAYNDAIAKQSSAVKELEAANRDLEIAMARNNLQMLKLQLAGMMRRRGNTRAEQRQMKQLEIANTQIRIEQMQKELEVEESGQKDILLEKEIAADKAQDILDRYLDAEQHNLWLLKDVRDEDIKDLRETIAEQEALLNERKTMLDTQIGELTKLQQQYDTVIMKIAASPEKKEVFEKTTGINVGTEANRILEPLRNAFTNPLLAGRLVKGSFQRGTEYVPETGFYKLHKGENVGVAEATQTSSNNVIVHINNPQIANDYDVTRMAKTLENVIRANLIDRTGKSKYRLS